MRITGLSLTNFRNFQTKELTFTEPRVLVLGINGIGKSTVFDAIRWCLTGRCRGLDGAGRGVEALRFDRVAKATDTMSVVATVVHAGETKTVTRGYDGRGVTFKVSGMAGAGGDQMLGFLAWLGVSLDALCMALDAELFFALAHGDAKAFLLGFLNIQIPLGDGKTVGFTELEGLYQEAYKNRADANRDLKNAPVGKPPTEAVGDLPGMRALMARLQAEKDDLVRQKGVMDGGATAAAKEATRLAQQVEGLKKARARVAEVAGADASLTAQQAAETAEQIVPHIGAAELEVARLSEHGAEEAALNVDFQAMANEVAALESHDPGAGCVLSAGVKCPVAKKNFVKAAEAIRTALETASSVRAAIAERETAKAAAIELRRSLVEAREAWAAIAEQLRTYDATIAEVEKQHTEAIASLPPDAGQTSTLDQQIADLSLRMATGHEKIRKHEALARDHQAYGERKDAQAALEATAKAWDAKVKLYGSEAGGLRANALAAGVNQFETTINAALEPFGFVFKVAIEPWGLLVNDRPLVALSMSERLRVATAFQMAVAVTSGLSFTLIDQIDALLSGPRGVMTRLVLAAPIEQIMLAKAQEPTAPVPTFQSGGVQVVSL